MRYRVAAAFASLAFVVALAAGLAGGVRVGTLLFRAVAGAAVFAALGAVAMMVLEQYLPELAGRPADADGAAETAAEAEAESPWIDIVLPEENPLAEAIAADLEPADETAAEPLEDAERWRPSEQGEPLQRGGPGVLEGGPPPVEELAAEPSGESGEADGDDALPSLDGLEMEESEPPAAAPPPAADRAGPGGTRTDPSQAARALRTWLKRDHEG